MAIQIVSGNLNVWGNNGNFETDRSTWGFPNPPHSSITRDSTQKTQGVFSSKVTALATQGGIVDTVRALASLQVGKKYLAKANVLVSSTSPICDDDKQITLYWPLSNILFTVIDTVQKTIAEAKSEWVTVELYFSTTISGNQDVTLWIDLGGSDTLIQNGILWVDQFEIYEYIDVEDPGDPIPDLEIDNVYHSENPITLTKSAAVNWQEITNYRLYNEVRVELEADSGNYETTLRDELPPTGTQSTFYLNEAFKGCFEFNPPSYAQSEIIRLTDRVKRFINFSGSLENTEIVPSELEASGVSLVLWGGLSKRVWPGFNFFSTYLNSSRKFMSWAPIEKWINRDQEDYLNFFCYQEFSTLKLHITAFFDDGTNEESITQEKNQVARYELYQIPTGALNSGVLSINPSKNLIRYDLKILNELDQTISETRVFHVRPFRHPRTKYFMFLNSLGTFEVLDFIGKESRVSSFSREIIQRFLPHNYNPDLGEFAVNSITMQNQRSISSGLIKNKLSKEWHEYLKDFMLSHIVYDVTSAKRVPVTVSEGNHQSEDQRYERFIRINAIDSFEDTRYTPTV